MPKRETHDVPAPKLTMNLKRGQMYAHMGGTDDNEPLYMPIDHFMILTKKGKILKLEAVGDRWSLQNGKEHEWINTLSEGLAKISKLVDPWGGT